MKTKKLLLLLTIFIFSIKLSAQLMVPDNTATHTAVINGDWFTASTWNTNTVPNDGAIVVIPFGKTVTYQGQSAAHIFFIKVAGNFVCTQTNSAQTTTLIFDTMMGTNQSKIQFLAGNASDGKIDITITPFDIEAEEADSNTLWNADAKNFFSDGAATFEVIRTPSGTGNFARFNTWAEAQASDTHIVETSTTAVNDGPGVLGRWNWDPGQVSLGLMAMGEFEIIGQEKTNMVKLSQDEIKGQKFLHLETVPVGWKVDDELVITSGGNLNAVSNGVDQKKIGTITGSTIELTKNLNKNHFGSPHDTSLHCYVGNLTRNITFKSGGNVIDLNNGDRINITQRGHIMAMHNDTNVQYKNAAFVDLGRTDKSKLLDDFIWKEWVEPPTFRSKISALGQECAKMEETPIAERVNMRGRYSIHLHRLGATASNNMAQVTGNVVWGNPGWGITHHDSFANVSNNVVFDVLGSGIVSEMGNETGFWDDNLVVKIDKSNTNVYTASLFHDDYLFSGQGLGMKGRGVICRGNVISDAIQGIGIVNFNAAIDNLHRHDAEALATLRGIYNVDNFPLSVNGYSKEGDGVMAMEVPLIFENTTIIRCNIGFKSIERDMGVNHESRSVFDGFKVWGAGTHGILITYQTDYSFKDVFISGYNNTSKGIYMWKHSHNHTFDGIELADLEYGISISKLVERTNNSLSKKTRNNDYTPWHFIDLVQTNVGHFYKIEKDGDIWPAHVYDQHSDNPIHFSSSDITTRPTTFTLIENNIDQDDPGANPPVIHNNLDLEVDVAAGDFTFAIDGVITDDLGSYNMGLEQAPAQAKLRLDYPSRIYEFASQAKFEEYLTANGVYKDETDNDQLYFIINEALPNRLTFQYTTFPVKIKINNASGGVYDTATVDPSHFDHTLQMESRFGTATQSSTAIDEIYYPFTSTTAISGTITHEAGKAIDGNTNGRKNSGIFQDGLVPVGSFSETQVETEPWYDLDLGEEVLIDFIDVWNTVELNGTDIETMSTHFHDFYVLISDNPFGTMGLTAARANATYEQLFGSVANKRQVRLNNLAELGQYVRIQAVGNNRIIKLAEVEVLGTKTAICKGDVVTWNPDNTWTPHAPTVNDSVIINNDYGTETYGSINCCELKIKSGKTLTINAAEYVKITHDLTNKGILNVMHESSLVMVHEDGQVKGGIDGTYNIHKTTPTYVDYDYTYWSSPTESEQFNGALQNSPANFMYKFNTSNFLDIYNVGSPTQTSGIPDSFDDNNDAWQSVAQTDIMTPGVGYIAMGEGSPFPFVPNSTGTNTQSVIFTGKVNTGKIEVDVFKDKYHADGLNVPNANITNTNSNLLGNPYPSAIDLNTFFLENNTILGGTFYYWTHDSSINTANPGPDAYNFTNNDYATATSDGIDFLAVNAGSTGATAPQYLASGQGFFANVLDNGKITFLNSMRVAGNNNQFRNSNNDLLDMFKIELINSLNEYSEQLIAFKNTASDEYTNGQDGSKLLITNEINFYSLINNDNRKFAIQTLSTFNDEKIINIGFMVTNTNNHQIRLSQTNGVFANNQDVFIKDNTLNSIHNLSNAPYNFNATENINIDNRFQIIFRNSALGTENFTTQNNIIVFGNDNGINISTTNNSKISKILIYNILGQKLIEKNVNSSEISIKNTIKKGQFLVMYIKMMNGNIFTKKWIKQ